jgi:circadian clock protein KaiB
MMRNAKHPESNTGHTDSTADFEAALLRGSRRDGPRYVLRLFVTGTTPRSTRAIQNLRALCEEHLPGRYDLEVIDIYQQPVMARGEQIIAAPTLVKRLPAPLRKFVGDLSDASRILAGLEVRTVAPPPTED